MTLTPSLRKLALTAHITFSVGWVGAVFAFLALAIAGVRSGDDRVVRGSYFAMNLLVRWVIVPIALASLLSGLISALGTKWGLFRQYWVLIKLVLTIIAVAVLLVQLEPIRELAAAAADPMSSMAQLPEKQRPLIHAGGGLIVLLLVQVLGVYKPRGMTPYGWRKEHETKAPS
ncbi:MAG: hypothetical protein Q8O67_17325 [Deltaproteobacteria bacterium]|nr:hypothetical protein [Deltaproteobacteria bacterium]